MISIAELTVRYGKLTAVDQLTLRVDAGELFGLVGPNGAGKTTTLKVLAGLLLPSEGRASVDGHDVVSKRLTVQGSIGYMADFFGVYDHLSVAEYLGFFGGIYGMDEPAIEARIGRLLELTRLGAKRDTLVRSLSRGMKQRLYFARAIVHDPPLLILDEPASGMDPRGRNELMELLRELNGQGKTIVISSHILSELETLCTSAGFLEKGKLVGVQALSETPAQTGSREVVLMVREPDVGKAAELIRGRPDVSSVKASGSAILIAIRDDDDCVSALVADLVRAGVRIQLPTRSGMDLQDAFFRMTKGETA